MLKIQNLTNYSRSPNSCFI